MSDIEKIKAVGQECSDYATSLRSAHMAVALEGRSAPSFLRAADLFERASSSMRALIARAEAAERDAARYRFLRATALDGAEDDRPYIHAAESDDKHWAFNFEAADIAIDAAIEDAGKREEAP